MIGLQKRTKSNGTLLLGILLFSTMASGAVTFTKTGDFLIDANALTLEGGNFGAKINGVSFQQDMIVTHLGWQYVAYYNGTRHVCVARRQIPSGSWQIVEFTDYYFDSNDAHNVISMGICPNDGTIHLAFDHHGDWLNYRVSQDAVASNPDTITWEAALFSSVRDYLETGNRVSGLTYPRFWQTPEGNLQMGYRVGGSGNGDSILADYDGTAHQWSNTREIISRSGVFTDYRDTSTSRCAYLNRYSYDSRGRLHATWCWRETTQWNNHDILYAYSDDGGVTWYNSDVKSAIQFKSNTLGQTLLKLLFSQTGPRMIGHATGNSGTELLMNLDSPGLIVVPISRYYGLLNQQTQTIDPWDQVHVVMRHCTDESYAYAISQGITNPSGVRFGPEIARRNHHYWRNAVGQWQHRELPEVAGTRPKLFIQRNGNAFVAYTASMDSLDSGSELSFVDGDLVIQAATAASDWTDWQLVHIEPGPFVNEVQGDYYRFQEEDILSLNVQELPIGGNPLTALRILDFECGIQ